MLVLKLSCPEKQGRCHHIQCPKEKLEAREIIRLAKVTAGQQENRSRHQVPGSVVLPQYLSCSGQGEPRPRASESSETGKHGGINATAPSTAGAAWLPCLAESTLLQPDYFGSLVHPPAATRDLNCSFPLSHNPGKEVQRP